MGTSIESYWGGAVIGVLDTGNQSVISAPIRSQEEGLLITHQNNQAVVMSHRTSWGRRNIFAWDWLWMRITDPVTDGQLALPAFGSTGKKTG